MSTKKDKMAKTTNGFSPGPYFSVVAVHQIAWPLGTIAKGAYCKVAGKRCKANSRASGNGSFALGLHYFLKR